MKISLRKSSAVLHLAAALSLTLFASCQKKETALQSLEGHTKNAVTASAQPDRSEAKLAMQCYNNAFYNQYGTYGPSFKAYYYSDVTKSGRMDFWRQAEAIETLIDAWNANNDVDFKNKIQYLYNGMRDAYGLLWSNNKYNDDIIWGALMCIRAFLITNDGGMKDMAKNNFDLVWSLAWDSSLGGGLWWTTDKTTKNACVNAPAAICAMFLFYTTGETAYRDKAKMIMDWMVNKLYVASTGEVKGAMNAAGVITEGARTYTQGTFIGACGELHNYYPSDNWKARGSKAMDYTKSVMCNASGLLPDEYDTDDTQGFKSIFARWACKFTRDFGYQGVYGSWLNYNAAQAWTYRNSSGLMWAQWWRRTPDNYVNSFETTCGVSMMNCVWLF
ncbi:MAG TPA: glycoside hydrolase family 76 protein [Chitinophaga sp.]|uniref:glycoside hydrolase family 76 protein n=1 Tax=Chitinophaga sp. TaxID=1869181 RepID=UPI002B828CFC|nr:glycoside hydrolase family 76 protein [Chitinophaga sp.]HVI46349.1 glycoside hydrolase family 76 protein [Chitinophaga sp.]